jgi:fructokinase
MDRASLLEMTRARIRDLVDGYLEAAALNEDIGSYLVRPALGDDAGVLGAMALARTAET